MSLQTQTTRIEPDIVVMHLSGTITLGAESGIIIEPLFNDLLNQDVKNLIFDLTGVEQMDSTGANIIIQCFLAARAAGARLRVGGASAKVNRLLRVTRLDTVILTPHMAAISANAQRAQRDLMFANLEAFFAGRPVLTPVPE